MSAMAEFVPSSDTHSDWNSAEFAKAVREGVRVVTESGFPARSPAAGQEAPQFRLPSDRGDNVSLKSLLVAGPALIVFFRGAWCSYCREELSALQASLASISSRGSAIVAISPDEPAELHKLSDDLGLAFPLLSDASGATATAYGLRWRISADLARAHASLAPELDGASDVAILPVPGRFVVSAAGFVTYADVDPDYTRRPRIAEFLPTLDNLARKTPLS